MQIGSLTQSAAVKDVRFELSVRSMVQKSAKPPFNDMGSNRAQRLLACLSDVRVKDPNITAEDAAAQLLLLADSDQGSYDSGSLSQWVREDRLM